jgi:DNA (cytosine-5)-methyltransferase 1
VTKLRVLDLFSGIGGFSLGLERAVSDGPYTGFETVAFCEIEAFPRKVLAKHWPEVACYDDVRTLTAERLAADGIAVDVICGGFPCQDISAAGNGAGISEGTRSGLWSEFARLIGELRPSFVIVENVAELLRNGMGRVCGDLASIGYDAEWNDVSAEDIGAPHPRSRIWIVAYPMCEGLERHWVTQRTESQITVTRNANDDTNATFIAGLHGVRERGLSVVIDANPVRPSWAGQQWPETQPLLCRVGDGIPDRVDRTSALGNAVVPAIPEIIGNAILESMAS